MASELQFGIKHIRDGIPQRVVTGIDMAVIGIVGTADSADAQIFPLDTPVDMYSNDTEKLTALGASGTLVDAVKLISAQMVGLGVSAARMVIVRVAYNATAQTVITNIIGNEASKTGMWALLDAPEVLGVTPRLIITPGYTSQILQGINAGAITPGSSGANGTFALGFTGGTGSGAAGTFTVTGGQITAVTITNPGVYTVVPTATFAASAGLTGASVVLTLQNLANGIVASIGTIASRLRAGFLPEAPTASRQAAIDWLETLPEDMRMFHPVRQTVKVLEGQSIVDKPASPVEAALYVRTAYENDGVPSRGIANQVVYGVVGVSPAIPFSIVDPGNTGQDDLEVGFGIFVRGDIGVDGALSDGGYVFVGTDTNSADADWRFASVVRMRDFIEILQVKATRYYLGRFNITVQLAQAIFNTLDGICRSLKADNHILDFRSVWEPARNTPGELRLGHLDITFKAEETTPFRKLTIRSRRYAEALEALAKSISIAVGLAGE